MKVSICIGTYGGSEWETLAEERAWPSAAQAGAAEIKMLHVQDGTIASVRNLLGQNAKSEWLCFLDADDELAPGYLGAMRRALERERGEHPETALLLMPAVSYVHGRKRHAAVMSDIRDLTVDNFLVIGTLVQRDLFLKVGGFEDYPHGFEDWSLWAKCWKAGAKIVQVPGATYIAYVNPRSKHRMAWRNRRWQLEMHNRIKAELFG